MNHIRAWQCVCKHNYTQRCTQVRMSAHNQGCKTSLVSLPRFGLTNRQVIKTKLHVYVVNTQWSRLLWEMLQKQNTLNRYFGVLPPAKKGQWSYSRRKSNLKCALMCAVLHSHTGELRKISWSQLSLLWDINCSLVKLLQFYFQKGRAKNIAVLKKLFIEVS